MSDFNVHEPAVGHGFELQLISDEQATSMGDQLHKLDLLIELIDHYGFQDLHIEEFATSLIHPASSEWPFSVFPEVKAVQDMYMHCTGMYAFNTYQTRDGTWTR